MISVEQIIIDWLVEYGFMKKGETINKDDVLTSRFTIDSLDVVDLMCDLEDKLLIDILDKEVKNIKTFGELVSFVEGKL